MLFNSSEFIGLFLPFIVVVVWFCHRKQWSQLALWGLIVGSGFFYAYWQYTYLFLLVGSIVFNYCWGEHLLNAQRYRSRWLLGLGVGANLALLGYFKYCDFLIVSFNQVIGTEWPALDIVLPLAISFFTFQQIAYLVDTYREPRQAEQRYSFAQYCLFIAFFPQLIAGPIVHHAQLIPQFSSAWRIESERCLQGFSIFVVGLFKKVVIADSLAVFANPVFAEAASGGTLTFIEAWGGALAYTFQLYFDFSGYSDMAIGLAAMLGIRLPINFNSPYKATSISDFWRRWHITLSVFLRDYLYISLGGNRSGAIRRYANLLVTMVLGGLWHGAGWTFLIWGGLHGMYLMLNHAWRAFRHAVWLKHTHGSEQSIRRSKGWRATGKIMSIALTFLCVVLAWVYFRSETIAGANSMLYSMVGGYGITLPSSLSGSLSFLQSWHVDFGVAARYDVLPIGQASPWLLLSAWIVWGLPNVAQLCPSALLQQADNPKPVGGRWLGWLRWRLSWYWGFWVGIALIAVLVCMNRTSEFLYFQF